MPDEMFRKKNKKNKGVVAKGVVVTNLTIYCQTETFIVYKTFQGNVFRKKRIKKINDTVVNNTVVVN